ncbi:hypothetical protein EB118_17875 [bacterium]|nr:hypothetical protein [bacterium]
MQFMARLKHNLPNAISRSMLVVNSDTRKCNWVARLKHILPNAISRSMLIVNSGTIKCNWVEFKKS